MLYLRTGRGALRVRQVLRHLPGLPPGPVVCRRPVLLPRMSRGLRLPSRKPLSPLSGHFLLPDVRKENALLGSYLKLVDCVSHFGTELKIFRRFCLLVFPCSPKMAIGEIYPRRPRTGAVSFSRSLTSKPPTSKLAPSVRRPMRSSFDYPFCFQYFTCKFFVLLDLAGKYP